MNPPPPAPRLVSAGMVDEWSHLLPGPERIAFVGACTEAGADDGRLQTILGRYFSTWKTSLMADDLSRLQMLTTYVQIRDFVKVICLEDDSEELEETSPSESSVIWPRHENGQVAASAIGVGRLKTMLAGQQLRPDRLKIRDTRRFGVGSNPEIAANLARIILDGADLAVTAFTLRMESAMTTIITAELSAEHQGQGRGFSILRKADLRLNQNLNSYWADQILLHAPALKELLLSFWQPRNISYTLPIIVDGIPWPALEKLELSTARLSAPSIMTMLSNSKLSLTGISFRLMTLGNDSAWAELLSRISNEFPHLTSFKLTNLSEGSVARQSTISFLDLDKDPVVIEPYKTGLKLVRRNPVGHPKRIPSVVYEGPNADHLLRIVAGCAVAVPR
ncbi:hypothetical protein V496_02969 [Pseudogymnoascus sp. VKM F-4515 (FW-2607)]|nr:hypothetical protein V496_02969 [Pseudogymnoascus sp. VKM F-4515 (FW-2607)]KFY91197.1 hypothetical protein V498_05587 [Pseudogymnoascus sp. VKM F-4517 (FW-2822)]